jgi:hypothetical protein
VWYYSGNMPEINPLTDEDSIRAQAEANAPAVQPATPTNQLQQQPQQPQPPQQTDVPQPNSAAAGTLRYTESEKLISRLQSIKKIFFLTLIACVGAAALVSVVAILIGNLNSSVWKTIAVIVSMAIHVMLILGYTTALFRQEDKTGKSALTITNVALFSLLIASFIITILTIWDIISGDMSFRSYGAMFVVLIASVHSDVLYNLRNISKALNAVIALNFAFIVLVAGMLVTAIIGAGEGWALLSQDAFFWRLLGAAGVIDASLTVISAIMLKMWQQTQPQSVTESGRGTVTLGPIVVKSLVVLIVLVIFWPFILIALGLLWFLLGAIASPFLLFV